MAGRTHGRKFLHLAGIATIAGMFQRDLLLNKRILITGGGTGLGKAAVRRFLELGAEVYICGRCEEVCPVKIPLPKMMRHLREREFAEKLNPPVWRAGFQLSS